MGLTLPSVDNTIVIYPDTPCDLTIKEGAMIPDSPIRRSTDKSVCNVTNRTIFCRDNLDILAGIDSSCIDLIYLDPPFNKNKKFTAPVGSSAEGASFDDIFREEDVKAEWLLTIKEDHPGLYHLLTGIRGGGGKPYNFAYLAYMAVRLIECRRVLKDTGSIYLHCDPTMSHYLKMVMDCIFGEENFRNEIVWCYTGPSNTKRWFPRKHDIIFFYVNDGERQWTFNWGNIRVSYVKLETGKTSGIFKKEASLNPKGKIPEDWWSKFTPVGRLRRERTGYPTQKPLALLERIIEASSNPGDMVLDPFCGCATTCIAAERLDRKWIGIDTSGEAYRLVRERLGKEVDKPQGDWLKGDTRVNMLTNPPKRSDQEPDHREAKYVYVVSNPKYPGEYKVGIAKDWKQRLNAYQTSEPDRGFRIEHTLLTPAFRETEKHIHSIFENKHEWVRGDLDDIIQAINEYKPVAEKQQSLIE